LFLPPAGGRILIPELDPAHGRGESLVIGKRHVNGLAFLNVRTA
jgi:hypothetical protein